MEAFCSIPYFIILGIIIIDCRLVHIISLVNQLLTDVYRLTAGDAKWIYDNCKLKTTVVIYSKTGYEPLKKPTAYKLPSWHTWDPTDPNMKYKCKQKGCH